MAKLGIVENRLYIYIIIINNKNNIKMKKYLTTLIEEKGKSLDSTINLDGHFGLTYGMLVDFIDSIEVYHEQIKETLVKIDFMNGDVFHYLNHLAAGMVEDVKK